jgi:RNA recognition motif-containing protein
MPLLSHRSFAYVTYASNAAASNAAATLDKEDLEGRATRVELSKPPRE